MRWISSIIGSLKLILDSDTNSIEGILPCLKVHLSFKFKYIGLNHKRSNRGNPGKKGKFRKNHKWSEDNQAQCFSCFGHFRWPKSNIFPWSQYNGQHCGLNFWGSCETLPISNFWNRMTVQNQKASTLGKFLKQADSPKPKSVKIVIVQNKKREDWLALFSSQCREETHHLNVGQVI